MKQLFISAAILVLFAGCNKKNLPESTTGDPLYIFSGTIDNKPVTYTAGDSLLYMFTDYYKDDQDIVTLRGYFTQHNCANCEPYLSFEFKDINGSVDSKLYRDIFAFFEKNSFSSYSLDSVSTDIPVENFKFIPDNCPNGTTYFWDFGDGDTSSQLSPTHAFKTTGVSNIRLITKLNLIRDTIIIPINVSPFSECRTRFYTNIIENLKQVTANAEGVFKSYFWAYGDGSSGLGVTSEHTYSNPFIYEILLSTSTDNCIAQYKRRVNFTGNTQYPLANYYYSNFITNDTVLLPRVNKSSAIITLKKDGKTYKSYKNIAGINQSYREVFKVNRIMPYIRNLNGEKTVQINGSIDLYLYNIENENDSIPIKSDMLNIAVAYP